MKSSKEIKDKLDFCVALSKDVQESVSKFVTLSDNEGRVSLSGLVFRDKNCGKTALRRKILYLRQELLNLDSLLSEVW